MSMEDPPPVDLEVLASNYSGAARIDRLMFVAEHGEQEALRLEAHRMAADLLKARP
jgi:hypothetical protein